MRFLMTISDVVDRIATVVNRAVRWLIVVTIFVSAGNAVSRKLFQYSSNSFLEIQWYLFSAVFLLSAGYVFLTNEHVRVDVLSQRFSPRVRAWIDLIGIAVFLVPFCLFLIWQSWPILADAWTSAETSSNAGGLVRWPAYALLPLGIGLLLMQAISEAIKRAAFLAGLRDAPHSQVDAAGSVTDRAV